ncbi:MAG: racemase [Burkholderiales bacterium]|nr:MAG: racemase [Burkholderiales bacterium]
MRIWHQSFTVLQDLPAYEQTLREHIARIVRPDTEVVLHGQRPGTYPTNYPGTDLGFQYLYWVHGNQWVANAIRAQREGFDAYAMCTMPNPMIREIRSLVEIPVTGYGESSALLACQLGRKFGVLTFIPAMVDLYAERIAEYGLSDRCVGVRYTGFGFHDVLAGYSDPGPLIERFMESARGFVRDSGADVLVGGSMPLSLLLAREGVSRVDDVPVVDGLAATLKMAEMMVELRRVSGLWVSRHGRFNAAPPPERVLQVMEFYGLDRLLSDPD